MKINHDLRRISTALRDCDFKFQHHEHLPKYLMHRITLLRIAYATISICDSSMDILRFNFLEHLSRMRSSIHDISLHRTMLIDILHWEQIMYRLTIFTSDIKAILDKLRLIKKYSDNRSFQELLIDLERMRSRILETGDSAILQTCINRQPSSQLY
ncbi:hypothetical protein BDV19DRAFT_367769 [Aspergillus venezuelensis]